MRNMNQGEPSFYNQMHPFECLSDLAAKAFLVNTKAGVKLAQNFTGTSGALCFE